MPSDKKPKKARKSKYADPKTGEFRHADGDRRHRSGPSLKELTRESKLLRQLGSAPPPDEPPDADE